jgi:hypothetical protein
MESHPSDNNTTDRPPVNGAAVVMVAENEAAVKTMLEEDVFAKNGIWDVEKAQIFPVSPFQYT